MGQRTINLVKYPRTPHLPWSEGMTDDDRVLPDVNCFVGKTVVVTEKMDGENTTMYCDHIHARSLSSQDHPSRHFVKKLWNAIKADIPSNFRLCGENLYAQHSIFYDRLPGYFMIFAVFNGETCLGWKETVEWGMMLGFPVVPVLYQGPWDEPRIKDCWTGKSFFGPTQEGYVVKNQESFTDFSTNMAKFVRKEHVQTDEHWMNQQIITNRLENGK